MKTKIISPFIEDKKYVPLVLLLVCIVSFGLIIPFLGFYWDDWLVIFHVQTNRLGDLITLYSFDRPLSAWTALVSAPLLNSSIVAWHLFSLFFRWLSLYLFYLSFVQILPKHKKIVIWKAILFAVYPAYSLQSVSVALSQHWIAYALFLFSIYTMGKAVLYPARRLLFTVLALFSGWLHLVTLEYFAGIELLRPIYLLALIPSANNSLALRLKEIFKIWSPYLALLFFWAWWRLFIIVFPV